MKCQGNHEHEPVVASLSGLYPPVLAQAFIDGLEKLFVAEGNESFKVFVGEAHEDVVDPSELPLLEDDFGAEDDLPVEDAARPTSAQRQAVLRLHQNTSHRASCRLAKALAIAGTSPKVIRAAKEIKCDVYVENAKPPPHRPVSLPRPRQFGDQVHVDLVSVKNIHGMTSWVMHGIDLFLVIKLRNCWQIRLRVPCVNSSTSFGFLSLGHPRWLSQIAGLSSLQENFKSA